MKKSLLYILLCVAFVSEAYSQRVIYHQMDVNYVDGIVEGHSVETIDNAKFVYLSYGEVLSNLLLMTSLQNYDLAEMGMYLSQALTTTKKAQSPESAYKGGWNFSKETQSPLWYRFYNNIGINAVALQREAEQKNMRNYVLIVRTLLLNSLLNTTDYYGELPVLSNHVYATGEYSNTQRFNTQAEIYAYLETQFQDLLAKYDDPEWINCATNAAIPAASDPLFAGDITKWRAYTKALYARFLVRQIPNLNNTPEMCQRIIAAADDALNDPSWIEPRYQYIQNCPWGPSQPLVKVWENHANQLSSAVPSTFFGAILGFYRNGISFVRSYPLETDENGRVNDKRRILMYALDPRAPRMFEPRVDATGIQGLRALSNNIGMDVDFGTDYKIDYFPDLYTTSDNANPHTSDKGYISLITKEELLFIKAEALYWKGDKTHSYDVMVQAVETSFARYGVYGNVGHSSTANIENEMIALFKEIRLPAPGTTDGYTIAHLMQQKYVAMYLQPEQWNDIRRYNYSSSANGVMYDNQYVYNVAKVFNNRYANVAPERFELDYVLRRPYNLHTDYWEPDSESSLLSDKAWINRINLTAVMYQYFKDELIRIGAWTEEGEVDYRWLQKKMIWQ